MDFKFLLGISCFLMAGVGLSEAKAPPGPVDYLTAKSEVEKYLENNQYTLDMKLREDPSDPSSSGLRERSSSSTSSRFEHDSESKHGPIFITIAFTKKVLPSSTVQDLRDTLNYVALDKLPMPGFKYPYGWDIYPRTPVSSFKDGVTIVSYQSGRLHFKVDTRFFAIYGIMRGLRLPADGRAPRYAYFSVRKDIHSLIDVNMPLVFAQSLSM